MLTAPVFLSAKAAENETPGAHWTFDKWRPTITSADNRFSLSLRTRLQLDTGGFSQPSDVEDVTSLHDVEFKHLNSGALVRRAYLGVEGRAFRDFWYEYRMNFGGAGFKIADPYIHLARVSYNIGSYDSGPLFRVNAGLIKPIFTYNDAMSSASLTFLERAAAVNVATETFGGGAPRLGAELTFQQTDLLRDGDNLMVSGAFTGHIASKRVFGILQRWEQRRHSPSRPDRLPALVGRCVQFSDRRRCFTDPDRRRSRRTWRRTQPQFAG